MAFTAKDVQTLRERTGVGMMDCKSHNKPPCVLRNIFFVIIQPLRQFPFQRFRLQEPFVRLDDLQ